MNYPPKHHLEYNTENMIRVLKRFPLASVVSTDGDELYYTHIPLLFKRINGAMHLVGHIDNNNPQLVSLQLGCKVKIVFHGPQSYISPTVYSTKQLPTWNYMHVHINGVVRSHLEKDTLVQSLVEITAFMEKDKGFKLESSNLSMHGALPFITGFDIEITKMIGRFKFSQDKSETDMKLAAEALIVSQQQSVREFVNDIIENHQQEN
ncbi:MAG: FMN-binding negative transcriptional regulator [Flavobacteriaceae bacterium]|nr:FMN-binding negative transcriptional regulator [Flavobacteriaceae bacterium]